MDTIARTWTRTLILSVWALLGGFSSLAWSHSDLDPRQSLPNKWETYTLTVPTETTVPTIHIRLTVPPEFEVETIEHSQVWHIATVRDERGYIREITWSDSRIPPQRFEQFKLLVRNAKTPGRFVWKIEQAYEGSDAATWEAQTQLITAEGASGQRAEEAWKAAQVATTVSLVALGIAITLIIVTLIGIVRRGHLPAPEEPS
jgi:uncharacterized protein YcnI